jgi:epoxyqueuosine reductase
MNLNPKTLIIETALSMGFERAVVASLDPLEAERKIYECWLELGYTAGMEYLRRHPEKRNSPALLCPEAYSAVLLFASYYTEVPQDQGAQFGRVAGYAVGRDYHAVIPDRLSGLKARLEDKLQRPLLGKYFTDDVELFEQGLAARHGLGFVGKNSLLIAPRLGGSFHFVSEFFTDLPLEADGAYAGGCGRCTRCKLACPTAAIVADSTVDSNLCISYLTIENKGAIPEELRARVGNWIFGCDECQQICPYNQSPHPTAWEEFQPEAGAGHYLNLFDILKIKSKNEFDLRFARTPLSRAKLKGLCRNALVVIGNRLPDGGEAQLFEFLETQQDPLLLEHGLWALRRYEGSGRLRKRLYEKSPPELRSLFEPYLDL